MNKCKKCGSEKIQTVMWVECNTHKVHGLACSEGADEQDNWCPDCKEHCKII